MQEGNVHSKLIIGPWHHWEIMDQLKFGMDDGIEWFNHFLKGHEMRRTHPVQIFLMGINKWLICSQFPPEGAVDYKLHLARDTLSFYHEVQDMKFDDSTEFFDSFEYNPHDPIPAIGGASFDYFNAGMRDNSPLESRDDVLVYSTEKLLAAVTAAGVHYSLICR